MACDPPSSLLRSSAGWVLDWERAERRRWCFDCRLGASLSQIQAVVVVVAGEMVINCTNLYFSGLALVAIGEARVEAGRRSGEVGWGGGGGRRWSLPASGFGIFEFDPTEAREWGFWLPPWIEVGMCQHPIPTETAIVVTRPFGFVKLIKRQC